MQVRCALLPMICLTGCDAVVAPSGGGAAPPVAVVPGMDDYDYLAADGGPHLVLPAEQAAHWRGVTSLVNPLAPDTDYGRAAAATATARLAVIKAGTGEAIAFQDPPMTAWGRSPDGLVDIYYLAAWTTTDLDALIERAVAATPTESMSDTGQFLRIGTPDVILMFAGDAPGDTEYGEYRIRLAPGEYRILEGMYQGQGEEVSVYRFQAVDPDSQ